MGKFNLNTADGIRMELTKQQQKEIEDLYRRVAKNIAKEAEKIPRTTSDAMRQQYLKKLQKQVDDQLEKLGKEIQGTITHNMALTAQAMVSANQQVLGSVGLYIRGAFSRVPDDVVRSVATGQLYKGDWSLSKAIWGNTQKAQKDINTVIAEGIAQNKSAYAIAKDLEKYVNPSAKKDWSWAKVYPGTNKKVDYNAQRLARTAVSHAYQQSFVRTTQKNPFVTKYKWLGSNSHRICPICAERDGKLFEKDELPLDHPNGMCTFVAVMDGSMVDMADRIADWYDGKYDPELDEYVKHLSGEYTPTSELVKVTELIPGEDSAEITDSIEDYFIPQATRDKLPYLHSLNSFDDFQKYFKSIGIQLDTDLETLSGKRRFDTIVSVKEMCEKIVVGVDSYKQVYGDTALSKLNRILLYSTDLDTTAAYYFNRIGEKDPMAGTIAFRNWNASGRVIFHELAHAFQDSQAKPGEDAVSFAQRVTEQAKLNPNFRAYSGVADDVMEAERFADAFGFGFYLGNSSGIEFIHSVQREMLKGAL